jgi:spore coat polysaccharide biosynthesis predicted glycosyltransferase SpsG
MGGSDPENFTEAILLILASSGLALDPTFVIGACNPHRDALERQALLCGWPSAIRRDVQDMATLMADSDLAISASGSTAWELACMGVPAILLVCAENQRLVAEELTRAEAATIVTDPRASLSKALADLVADKAKRKAMADRASELVDGCGATRVAAILAGLEDNKIMM